MSLREVEWDARPRGDECECPNDRSIGLGHRHKRSDCQRLPISRGETKIRRYLWSQCDRDDGGQRYFREETRDSF